MKILYDISVLGMAHYHQTARTGVYRVTSNVLQGVLASGEFEFKLFASQGNDSDCVDFLKATSEFSSCIGSFVPSIPGPLLPPLFKPFEKLLKKGSRSFFGKELKDWSNKPWLSAGARVCHSPYFPTANEIINDRRITKIQTVHDLIPLLMPQLFANNNDDLIHTVLSKLDSETFVICMSESTRNDLLNHKKDLDPAKVSVVYSAASDTFYPCRDEALLSDTRQKYGIPADARYLLSVSTIEPRKNIDHLIRCFLELLKQERLNDLYLVLTGVQGWKFDGILAEIEGAEKFKDRIIMTGFVPDLDLAPIYSGALAFVYMSLYEGFGLPPLEAMQCGIPVIASNSSSLPEVVGDAGILLDTKDADGLCQAYLKLYQDCAYAAELSKKSLTRAAHFSWENTVSETIEVYRKAARQ